MNIDYQEMSTEGLNKVYRDAASKGNLQVTKLVAEALRERGINVPDRPTAVRQLNEDYFTDGFANPLDNWDAQSR